MTTITLEYNERDQTAKQLIDTMLDLGLLKRKKSGIEQAIDEVKRGDVSILCTPKNRQKHANER